MNKLSFWHWVDYTWNTTSGFNSLSECTASGRKDPRLLGMKACLTLEYTSEELSSVWSVVSDQQHHHSSSYLLTSCTDTKIRPSLWMVQDDPPREPWPFQKACSGNQVPNPWSGTSTCSETGSRLAPYVPWHVRAPHGYQTCEFYGQNFRPCCVHTLACTPN